ncbi:endonuclease MutS2 [Clostridium botulinum]|uniref:Endonuclease MutS2 n=1 Tax=Clostridium botulinum C/D str. DC5 TaxID=1443128 RepID=A0A0A0ICJ4_CLOBO|nr:endonuclease MutS2 [Clostridium botulinum]KEI01341.1 recombination and DNA strand exchange inhibitor protein [Clostridium botulinum C/D str. BKT75002]KEI12814.1 recombination and DNA strand exchange inhibitor protein [Clostridium botulinum C/D str. BKT2873]KGM98652.1 recombination and DNA strand exchange inhibitor protein [Clostridium botulinum C/D str. DC5]KOC50042.1 recombination and DNA strand exchange inhibitor protein [Clostridium botulinum]KOC52223.1 recombination and DNA strand excha
MNHKALRVLEFDKIKEELKKYTQTSASKDLIDELQPYENAYEVREHLMETKEAFEISIKKGDAPFQGLYDAREGISKAQRKFTLLPVQLLRIANLLKCSRRFKSYVKSDDENEKYTVLESITEGIVPLSGLEEEIFKCIIGEEELSDRASTTLFNIRRSLKDKTSSIKSRVNSLIRTYSQHLQENIYTVRGERYVLPVKVEHKGAVPGLVHDQSSSGATLFIEPMSLVDLNNEIKELRLKERDEIERILTVLSGKVYDNIDVIKVNADILWELDFIFAKAKYAAKLDAICPTISEDGHFNIIRAKHPLIDPKKVVENNIYLREGIASLVITGPNTGGKTVTLKTVGLMHIMAMSGLMITAAQGSTISFFKEVFADIGDEQSIEQSLSTFSSHMTNIVNIIDNADENSLVLFDELGAGTDPTEGAALAVSILENLRERNTKVIATTHYSELKAYALKVDRVENASVEFDVETLRPTYRLLIGVPGKSNAFEISKRLGLPDYIIEDAKKGIDEETLKFEDLIQSLQHKNIKAQEHAREAEGAREEAVKLKEKYESKLDKFKDIREKAILNAQKEAKEIIKDAKEESDKILKDIRELERMGYSSDVRKLLEENRKKLKEKLEKTEEKLTKPKEIGEPIDKVAEGDEVYLPKFDTKVMVLTNPDSKGDVQVQAGIMKIKVNIKDLRKTKETKIEKRQRKKREVSLNLKSVASSVDLRGMDSQEAVYTADKYLDDACMGGLGEVTIIHGKGTGILRNSINDMLKRHPHVKSYRLGNYGEGGNGVTVVELK